MTTQNATYLSLENELALIMSRQEAAGFRLDLAAADQQSLNNCFKKAQLLCEDQFAGRVPFLTEAGLDHFDGRFYPLYFLPCNYSLTLNPQDYCDDNRKSTASSSVI